eukprot:c17825_g1_i1 orf=295-1020(+)
MPSELLSIEPGELKFPFELKKQITCSLRLVNSTDNYVAFKVKTTSPKKYCVRPNTGIVMPRSSCDVAVTMQAQREMPPDMQCKDKFLVQSVVAPDGATANNISLEMFNKEGGKEVFEVKLRVVYISPPQPPPSIPESVDEAISPTSSPVVDNGPQAYSSYEMASNEVSKLKAKLAEAQASVRRLTDEKKSAVQKTQQLQEEIASMAVGKRTKATSKSAGFSLLFVFLIGILGFLVGYLLHS